MTTGDIAAGDEVTNTNTDVPLVSVVLPTYNRASQVMSAIDSVLRQTYTNLELVVVDDGSDDDSISLIQSIKDKRLKLLALPVNRGANTARNLGIRECSGDYVCFQDSDDFWHPTKLETQIGDITSHDSKITFCAIEKTSKKGKQLVPKPGYKIPVGESDLSTHILRGSFISCQTLVVEKDVLKESGGFDDNLDRLQDWELAIRLSLLSKIYYNPAILVQARVGNDSISENEAILLPSIQYIYKKHLSKFQGDRVAQGILFINQAILTFRRGELLVGTCLIIRGIWEAKCAFGSALLILSMRR